jgi:hypothetical protein
VPVDASARIWFRLYRSIIQWNSKWKTFELLRFEEIVRIEISNQSHKNNCRKCYKARAVLDWRKKGEQKDPKDGVKSPKGHPGEPAVEPFSD